MADNSGYNSMQANLGLIPGAGPQVQVKSPAQAAAELSQQASMQMQQAQQMMPVVRSNTASFSFGQQYQQQFQAAQAQSSMNPYAAGMFGSFTQPSALPSPLMMTPASTGNFRPPMPFGSGAGGSPMSPMAVMPMFQTPFTPQLPTPSFRTPWEQEIQQRELRADQLYSMTSQAPRFGGMAAGYGIGAMAGAAAGSRFGAVGRGAGAVLGGLLAHYSGFSEGMGAAGMMPFRPGREGHEMGLSAQRMSQDWVVGGPNLHELGRGLSRGSSMALGTGIQRMAESQSFKAETGGMFNRHDLMQIMQKSGQAGMMDMDQGVGRIQQQLRDVSRTVRRFMELTNDPDVTSVIKQMGQMHSLGMSVPEIEKAASSMRAYSRAAGTTVGGLYQQGLPGAMTYQGLGLSGGAGLQYGMYSAAAARQAVASGTFSNAELSMFGGVQGVAQRNMQAQGAFMSMPMFGASISSYGAGGWGMNAGSLARMGGGGAGPQGMVMGAVSNMNAALGAGGIGALAMMPLQQKQIMDQAARTMTPYEQTAMRFSMASDTGKFLGLKGAGGFAAGARMLYGDEVASQMMTEAANPAYWRAQKAIIQRERDDIARSQRQDIMDATPGAFSKMAMATGVAVRDAASPIINPITGAVEAMGRGWKSAVTNPLQEFSDMASGITTYDQTDAILGADRSTKAGRKSFRARQAFRAKHGKATSSAGGLGMTGRQGYDAFMRTAYGDESMGGGLSGLGLDAASTLAGFLVPALGMADMALSFAGVDTGEAVRAGLGSAYLAYAGMAGGEHKTAIQAVQDRDRRLAGTFRGAASRTMQSSTDVYAGLEKSLGLKGGQGLDSMISAGRALARAAEGKSGILDATTGRISDETIRSSLAAGIANATGKSQAAVEASLQGMSEEQLRGLTETTLAAGQRLTTAEGRNVFRLSEERAAGGVGRSTMVAVRDQIAGIKNQMGDIEKGWGIGAGDTRDELRKLVANRSPAEIMAAISGKTKKGNAAWEARIREETQAELGPKATKAQVDAVVAQRIDDMGNLDMSKDLQTKVSRMVERGDAGLAELTDYINNVGALQGAEYASSAFSGMSKATGLKIESEADLRALSAGDIQKLGKDSRYANLAGMLSKRKKATGGAAEQLQTDIYEELANIGSSLSSESNVSATGEKARGLTTSEKKLSEVADQMSASFKYFTEDAAKNFRDGAVAFNEAMRTGQLKSGIPD
jgi:hypothetical protein